MLYPPAPKLTLRDFALGLPPIVGCLAISAFGIAGIAGGVWFLWTVAR